jgi:hypothetical protein
VSVVAFGSFAREEADAHSDIDLAVVRADDVDDDDDDDDGWAESIDAWRRQVRTLTGNDVEIIEATASEATRKLRGRSDSGGTSSATGSSFTGGRSTNSQAGCVPIGHSQMVGTG